MEVKKSIVFFPKHTYRLVYCEQQIVALFEYRQMIVLSHILSFDDPSQKKRSPRSCHPIK